MILLTKVDKNMNYYIEAFKRYVDFNGRSSRSEYWYFILFNLIVSMVLVIIDLAIGTYDKQSNLGLLSGLYQLAVFLPALALAVRRLHDTDRSGWFVLLVLLPIVGTIVYIVLLVLPSDSKKNKYGSVPKKLIVVREK